MARVGIVGGLGVGATVHYYENIAKACKVRGVVPDLAIIHADVDYGQSLVRAGELDKLGDISPRSSIEWPEPVRSRLPYPRSPLTSALPS